MAKRRASVKKFIEAYRKAGIGHIIYDYDSVAKIKGKRYANKFIKAKYYEDF